ncbi:MAG: putative sulfate exporter family transporter [Gammaproteobacteria bacterium]|nr:putative sulfate exporter family transporter [Gammaproteobacteria bacterium]
MFDRLASLANPHALKWTLVLIAFVAVLWVGHPALALFVGATMSVALAPPVPAVVERGGKLCLKSAIVVLGFTLNVEALWQTSRDYSGLVVVFVACTLIAGLVIGRLMKVDDDQTRLLTTGTAICGGTAIVTLAPVIRARPESVAICIGIVFILNAIAILVLPWVGHQLQMTQDQFGVWAALAIHDTSSVVGAAAIFGDRALETATTVKLVRTLLLIPVVLVAGILLRQREARLRIPAFLALFVAASIAGTLLQPPAEVIALVKAASRLLLIVALFFIGMEIRRSTLASLNGRAIWLSLLLWSILLPITLLAAMFW